MQQFSVGTVPVILKDPSDGAKPRLISDGRRGNMSSVAYK